MIKDSIADNDVTESGIVLLVLIIEDEKNDGSLRHWSTRKRSISMQFNESVR